MASVWDIRAPFIFHGILAAVAIVPSFSSVAETAPGRARRRGRHGVEEESVEEQGGSDLRFIAREMMRPHMLAFLVAEFLANIARGINRGGILLLYATYVYGVGAATLGGLATLNAIVSIPIGFSAGYLMDRFGRKTTIVPGFALIAVAMAVMALVAWAQWPFLVFVAAYVFLHASQSLTGGNMQVLASDLAPSRARGRFFAIWRIFGEGGTAFSPVWFAVLAESIAYSASFGVFGVAAFGCSMIIAFLVRDVVGDERRAARVASGSGS
jgi:MFS family permease